MATPSKFRRWAFSFLLCSATAIAISATAYLCAWYNYRNISQHRADQASTRGELELLREEIERHREATGKWPERLTDLNAVKEKQLRLDEAGLPVDWWGRPLEYRLAGANYVLFSYGRDGRPGGSGQDTDLFAGQPIPDPPTFWEFTQMQEGMPVQLACLLAGAVAFPLCLLQAKGRPGNPPSQAKILLMNAVTAFFAILAALMIGTLHVMPGGH